LKWNLQKERYYLGPVRDVYKGYANDLEIREGAASGGIISALLIDLLEKGEINGALVSRCVVKDGPLRAETVLATSRSQILNCRTSIYFDFKSLRQELLEKTKDFDGKIAVAGLPCDLRRLRRLMAKDARLSDKVHVLIGLFCGHNSQKDLILRVLGQKGIHEQDIVSLTFRKGLWRGRTYVELKNGREINFPFQHYSVYQNLHILAADKCAACTDHTAELADISTGDIWIQSMKKMPVKHSIFLSRSPEGTRILLNAIEEGKIRGEAVDAEMAFNSNKRGLIYHKALAARARMAPVFGKRLKLSGNEAKARWNEMAAAMMVYGLQRLCRSRLGKERLFRLPRRIVWGWLVVFKLLTSF